MKILGLVFIGLALFISLMVLFFATDVPAESAYGYTYTWAPVPIVFCLSAGLTLLLVEWNLDRQKRKGKSNN